MDVYHSYSTLVFACFVRHLWLGGMPDISTLVTKMMGKNDDQPWDLGDPFTVPSSYQPVPRPSITQP